MAGKHRKEKSKPGKKESDWCISCDLGKHHPGRAVKNCKCPCGSASK